MLYKLLIAVLIIVVSDISFGAKNCEQQRCIAVVDAGSSASRLHFFSYDLDESNTPINIKEQWSKKLNPGIADLELSPAVINDYLNKLFSTTDYSTPVATYFYATGGMRLLAQNKQQKMHGLIADWFQTQPSWNLIKSKTLSGKEEGLYDWLSVNYQLGKLQGKNFDIGVLDIGGASVQIAFPIPTTIPVNKENQQQISLYGKKITLFIHSFLGLGQNEASRQFFDKPACFPINYPMPDGKLAKVGDIHACKDQIEPLVNEIHKVHSTMKLSLIASQVKHRYALGAISMLTQDKRFAFSDNQFSPQALLDRANSEICMQDWSKIAEPNHNFLYGYCLFPAYYYALMVDGYGILADKTIKTLGSDKTLDWSMGVVLHQQT